MASIQGLNKEEINLLRKALQESKKENQVLKQELSRAKKIIQSLSESQKVVKQRTKSASGKLASTQAKYKKAKRINIAYKKKLKKAKISTSIQAISTPEIKSIQKTREQVFSEWRVHNLAQLRGRIVDVLGINDQTEYEALNQLMTKLQSLQDDELRAFIRSANLKSTYYDSQAYDVMELYDHYDLDELHELVMSF